MYRIKEINELMKNPTIKEALDNYKPSGVSRFKTLSSTIADQIINQIQDAFKEAKRKGRLK